jgi:hypothetical protein
MTIKIVSRTVDYNGTIHVVSEEQFKWIEEDVIKNTGESVEDAIERFIIESMESHFDNHLYSRERNRELCI